MFSVVIPTYNRAQLLPRCLHSVLAQSFVSFEVIVVDDGSCDETETVIRNISANDSRVHYVRQANSGAAAARNLGASSASGQYLTFLDSDDEVYPDWLNTFSQALWAHTAEVVCCGIEYVTAAGHVAHVRRPPKTGANRSLLHGLYRSGTFAIRREVFEEVSGYTPELKANQHSELRYRLELQGRHRGWRAICLPDVLVRAHQHTGPRLRQDAFSVFESARYILEEHAALMRENPITYSSWATACGGAAARLGRFREARVWFGEAIRARPGAVKNYLRLGVAYSPVVRKVIWNRNETKSLKAEPNPC